MYMYMYKKVHKYTNFLKFYVCCDDSWDAPRGTIFGDDFGVKKKNKKGNSPSMEFSRENPINQRPGLLGLQDLRYPLRIFQPHGCHFQRACEFRSQVRRDGAFLSPATDSGDLQEFIIFIMRVHVKYWVPFGYD